MKRTSIILAGLLFATVASAANFQAVQGGDWHDTNTWGVLSYPSASDNVDLNGKAVTMTGTVSCASLNDVATAGSLDFGANASFTCRAVTNALLTTSAAGVVVDCDYTLTVVGNGFTINAGGEVTIAGAWNNSGSGTAVFNNQGTVTDFSGSITNSSNGGGVVNAGTVTDFSGSIVNSGSGYGVYNNAAPPGTWTAFSGSIVNSSGGYGVYNSGTWSDFSGSILNDSGGPIYNGYGAYNVGTWTDFSGSITNSATGWGAYNYIGGIWSQFSGTLNNSGNGPAASNYGTWEDFSGTLSSYAANPVYNIGTWEDFSGTLVCNGTGLIFNDTGGTWTDFSGTLELNSLADSAIGGDVAIPFSGTIRVKTQPDLSAANIKKDKVVLGVTGTMTSGSKEVTAIF